MRAFLFVPSWELQQSPSSRQMRMSRNSSVVDIFHMFNICKIPDTHLIGFLVSCHDPDRFDERMTRIVYSRLDTLIQSHAIDSNLISQLTVELKNKTPFIVILSHNSMLS